MSKVFANDPRDWDLIPGQIIPKTQKIVLYAALLNTQHYDIRIKGKMEQSKEWSRALLFTSVKQLLKSKPSGHPRLRSPTLLIYIHIYIYIYIYIERERNFGDNIYIYIYIYILNIKENWGSHNLFFFFFFCL